MISNDIYNDKSNFIVKLIDFGMSKIFTENDLILSANKNISGTKYYMAPELVCGSSEKTFASDAWAFPCVLKELCCNREGWDGVLN